MWTYQTKRAKAQRGITMSHATLNAALIAGNVDLTLWPANFSIGYGETARVVSNGLFISVCRFENGEYETAISYSSQCDDFQKIIKNN